MKNIKIIKKKEADKYFLRNIHSYNDNLFDQKIVNLIKINNVIADKVLEIGCANGNKLNQYSKLLKSKKNYGVDLSKKAIQNGKKKYKNLNLLNISSLEIDKIKLNFDLIICGFFLYHLDRELIFQQFDLISKKLNKKGFLLIVDFDPLFKHSNKDFNEKNLVSYKMSYDNFLVESGLFEVIYKFKYKTSTKDKRQFKSDTVSMTLFRKIDFQKKYPEDL
jgi:ubiquinone/menaquinone biosynthesis C-methylase UbiE